MKKRTKFSDIVFIKMQREKAKKEEAIKMQERKLTPKFSIEREKNDWGKEF